MIICKKNSAENSKLEFFWSHTVCIGVVFRKMVDAKVKNSSNHLKFCTGCFNDKPMAKNVFSKKLKSRCKNKHPIT